MGDAGFDHTTLGLSSRQHIMASSFPTYVKFALLFASYAEAFKEEEVAKERMEELLKEVKGIVEDGKTFYTVDKTCATLDVTPNRVTALWRRGELVGVKWRRRLYILRDSVMEFQAVRGAVYSGV